MTSFSISMFAEWQWALMGLATLVVIVVLWVIYLALFRRTNAISTANAKYNPEFMNKLLATTVWGSRATILTSSVAQISHCGDGKASTTDRVVIDVTYHDLRSDKGLPDVPTLPSRMLMKDILLPNWLRLGASPSLMQGASIAARILRPLCLDGIVYAAINAYNRNFPHAPNEMYSNEARVCHMVRPELPTAVEAPEVFGTLIDDKANRYCVLMEDLSLRGAVFPTAVDSLSVDHVKALLDSLAALHAKYWETPKFEKELDWLPTPRKGGMYPVFHTLGFGLIRNHIQSNPFEQELLAPLGLTVEDLWEGLCRAEELLDTAPVTLCHGDTHIQNTYYFKDALPSSPFHGNSDDENPGKKPIVGLFDWQLTLRASWSRDVSYILGTALSSVDRKEHEHYLLEHYFKCLRNHASEQDVILSLLPTADEAFVLYSQAMAWGLVIGWLICPPNNYGLEITSANIRKLVTACVELNTFGTLGISGSK